MNLDTLLKEFFTENNLMQLATVSEGQPWLCNVYFATDDENNIYWTSAKSRRHSKEILNDARVAVTIVHDSEKKQALQITGAASQVSLKDSERVNKIYGNKMGFKESRLQEVL